MINERRTKIFIQIDQINSNKIVCNKIWIYCAGANYYHTK